MANELPPAIIDALTGIAASSATMANSSATLVQTQQALADTAARTYDARHADRIIAARTLSPDGVRIQSRLTKLVGSAASVAESMALVADVAAALGRFTTTHERQALLVELVSADSDQLNRGVAVAASCVATSAF